MDSIKIDNTCTWHDRSKGCSHLKTSSPDGNGTRDNFQKSQPLVPPYWSHRRYESYASVENTKPAPITLEDHTEGSFENSGSLWAKGVSIDEHVIVAGSLPHVGDFVVWNCKIDTLDVSQIPASCPVLHLICCVSCFNRLSC